MKRALLAMTFVSVGLLAFGTDLENYELKTLTPKFAFFDGYYYFSKESPEKLKFNFFTGPSTELRQKFDLVPESKKYLPMIDGKLILGNIVEWGSFALLPADIAFLANYGNSMPLSTSLSVYFGVLGVSLLGEIIGGAILYDAKNYTDEAVWEYNKAVTFGGNQN